MVYRRAMLATLVFAGLRIGEMTALRWRDVDLAGNRITVHMSKTDAGVRQIDLLPVLHNELTVYKAQAPHVTPDGFVFATAAGTELIQGNIRRCVLDKAVEKANEKLTEAGDVPLPDGLTPHKLRHTFASILVALGVDPGSVMDQLGHTDPGFTLRVYRHGMRGATAPQRSAYRRSSGPLIGHHRALAPKTEPSRNSSPSRRTGRIPLDCRPYKVECPRQESNLDLPLRRNDRRRARSPETLAVPADLVARPRASTPQIPCGDCYPAVASAPLADTATPSTISPKAATRRRLRRRERSALDCEVVALKCEAHAILSEPVRLRVGIGDHGPAGHVRDVANPYLASSRHLRAALPADMGGYASTWTVPCASALTPAGPVALKVISSVTVSCSRRSALSVRSEWPL
ncbi:MAG: site-specific integrase [Solirubrobacteraceae bacterium]